MISCAWRLPLACDHTCSVRMCSLPSSLPVDQSRFPGSPEQFQLVNTRLRQIASAEGADFFDWGSLLPSNGTRQNLFYRDSFHPNEAGAAALARTLRDYLLSK